MYLVAYGLRPDQPLPEIYHPGMAEQWAALAQWSTSHTSNPMRISGTVTQSPDGYSPAEAFSALRQAFAHVGESQELVQANWSSNMIYPSP
jgi:hypothetical protein